MSTQFSIMIGNRSRFEAGDAGGCWLDMPATKEQLHEAMQSVGITADNPQDFSIRGYSDDPDNHIALPYEMVCAAGVDELNFLAARLEQLDPAEIGKLNAAIQRQNGFENIGQIIDFTYNVDYFVHIPEVHTTRDLGDYYLNKSGMVNMPDEWKGGIDLAAFGRNAAEQEKGAFTEYGYIMESGDEWERQFEGRDVPEEYHIMSYPQPERTADLDANQPIVTVVWSESNGLQDGEKIPLFRANEIFRNLDAAKLNDRGYDKTRFEIDYTMNGEARHYEGRQDFGDGDGSLIEHIEKFHTGYAQDEEYRNRLLHNDGQEAMEQTIAGHEQVINEFVPYLKLHCSLSEMEQAAKQAMHETDSLTLAQAAYYEALQQYVDDCRALLNQGNYDLPAAPRLSDFDPDLQAYKQQVTDEITQEASSAGMTVEEYSANGYGPRTPATETPVFEKLSSEQQQALSDTVKNALQMLIDADTAAHGEVTNGTLEAVAAQGYSYRDGQLEKQPEKEPDEPQPTETPQTAAPYYAINESAARRAKEMNSFDDYRPGSATATYRQYVDEAVQLAERQKARVDPMYHDKIDSLLDTYARKLAANMNASYSIEARVPSIMISGGGNFPVRQKEKQNAARDRNMEEWQDIQGLLDKIRSTGMGGISADDPQAVQKLEKKLESLTKAQENMKAINAYYRKHNSLDGCPLVSPEQGQRLISGMEHYDRAPYPTWALSNNNAEIRRIKERIKSLSRQKEIGFVGWEFEGGKVEANTTDNRLQIFFDEKPDAAIREELKGNGFRWSPRAGAWQRQLTDNAYYAANHIKAIQPLTGEKPTELLRAHIRQKKQNIRQEQNEAADNPAPTIPAPDDTISIKEMQDYGYSRDGMLPLRQETAEKLFSQDIDVFRIYEDGTEGAVTDLSDLQEHAEKGGLFGVEKEAWEALYEYNAMKQELRESEPEKEALLLYGKENMFGIYQLSHDERTRDLRFEPYDRLQAAGNTINRANYDLIYTAPLVPDTSLEDIFIRFNIDHPADFTGHSLSMSDIIVLSQGGNTTAYYIDRGGYRQVPEFLQEQQKTLVPDEHTTGETIRTPRGTFYLTDMTPEQMKAAGYGVHHTSEDGQYLIMGNGTQAFAVAAQPEKKQSIRAQLKVDKEKTAQKKTVKSKNHDLEV